MDKDKTTPTGNKVTENDGLKDKKALSVINKGGRPKGTRSKYKSSHPAMALRILSQGGLLCHVAAGLGIDQETLRFWRKDPSKTKLQTAIKIGLAKSEVIHADRLSVIAREGKGNVSAQLRIMEWGFGWKNVQTIENQDSVKEMSMEDIDKKIAELQESTENVVKFRPKGP